MAWEEENAAPYLPPSVLAQLKREHNRLVARGLNPADLRAHSQWEERIFQRYCPQEVCDQVLVDHQEWEAGRLWSRERKRGAKGRLMR